MSIYWEKYLDKSEKIFGKTLCNLKMEGTQEDLACFISAHLNALPVAGTYSIGVERVTPDH